jgi:hypothetical protein
LFAPGARRGREAGCPAIASAACGASFSGGGASFSGGGASFSGGGTSFSGGGASSSV